MAMTKFIQDGKVIDYVAGADIAYMDVVPLTTCIGVAGEDIPSGATGSVSLTGVYELPAVSTAIAVGDAVYWNASDKKITATATNNVPAGMCVAAKASGVTTIRVRIG